MALKMTKPNIKRKYPMEDDISVRIFIDLVKRLPYSYNENTFIDLYYQKVPISRNSTYYWTLKSREVWKSFVTVARNFVDTGQKTPSQAVIWLIETSMPLANIIHGENKITKLPTLYGTRERKSTEERRKRFYVELKNLEQKLYDKYYNTE
jgi:hypothetical protein